MGNEIWREPGLVGLFASFRCCSPRASQADVLPTLYRSFALFFVGVSIGNLLHEFLCNTSNAVTSFYFHRGVFARMGKLAHGLHWLLHGSLYVLL
jgi:hypothetical protein